MQQKIDKTRPKKKKEKRKDEVKDIREKKAKVVQHRQNTIPLYIMTKSCDRCPASLYTFDGNKNRGKASSMMYTLSGRRSISAQTADPLTHHHRPAEEHSPFLMKTHRTQLKCTT
jgi:hypothetical protein